MPCQPLTQGASDPLFIIIFLIVIIYDGHCFNCSEEIITLVAKATQHIGYKSSQQKGFAKLLGWVGGVGWESTGGAQLWSLRIVMFKLSPCFFHWGTWSHLEARVCQLLSHSGCFLFPTQPVDSFASLQNSAKSRFIRLVTPVSSPATQLWVYSCSLFSGALEV